jgi:hypothetical protein
MYINKQILSLPIRFNTVLPITLPSSASSVGEGRRYVVVMAREYHREKSSQTAKLIATAYDPRSATDYLLSVDELSDDDDDDLRSSSSSSSSSSSMLNIANNQSTLSMASLLSNGGSGAGAGLMMKKKNKMWGVDVSDETSPEDLAKDLEMFHARGKVSFFSPFFSHQITLFHTTCCYFLNI